METFAEYEEAALSTAIYPGKGTPLGLNYCALKLNGEAGELAEHVGKAIRDDGLLGVEDVTLYKDHGDGVLHAYTKPLITIGELTNERLVLIEKEVGDVLWYLAGIARELGTDLGTLARRNIEKLAKRKQEGKLGGSGDNR